MKLFENLHELDEEMTNENLERIRDNIYGIAAILSKAPGALTKAALMSAMVVKYGVMWTPAVIKAAVEDWWYMNHQGGKEEEERIKKKYGLDEIVSKGHGGPYDRGSADYYYRRGEHPHYMGPNGRVEEVDMTDDEIREYYRGYDQAAKDKDQKDYF